MWPILEIANKSLGALAALYIFRFEIWRWYDYKSNTHSMKSFFKIFFAQPVNIWSLVIFWMLLATTFNLTHQFITAFPEHLLNKVEMFLPAVSVVLAVIASSKFHQTTSKAHTTLVVFFTSITQLTIYFYALHGATTTDLNTVENSDIAPEASQETSFNEVWTI